MRKSVWLVAILSLTGCGGGGSNLAVEACAGEIATRLSGKTFALDKADMAAKAKAGADNVTTISSSVTFDAGLPGESKQGFECKTSIEGGSASVIQLTFSW